MKKILAMILALSLIVTALPGCAKQEDPEAYVPTGDAILMEGQDPADLEPEKEAQLMTLAYNPERSMNPLIGYNQNNRVLFSLMYQGLFAVDSRGNSHPILCGSYQVSPNNMTWTFFLDEKATFADGTKVTMEDVLASYNAARNSDYYKGRFTYVDRFEISENTGGLIAFMTTPYANLPVLMDVPIVKAADVDADHPMGSGPYAYTEGLSGAHLAKVENWWCQKEIPARADVINLVEADSDAQVRDEFEFGDVSLTCTNPMSDTYADYRCDYELWDVDSGMLLYLGCNVLYSDYFEDGVLRQILTYAIDREGINQRFYRGHAQPATLILPPSSIHYSNTLAAKYEYDPLKFIDALGTWTPPKKDPDNPDRVLKLLVNCDDSARLRTARFLAKTLTEYGIPTGTLEYGGATKPTYEEVLRANTFDLHLGQTRLPANYDLSEFFRLWGNLSYGGIPHDNILNKCKEALSDTGNYYSLLELLADDGRIIPVLFGTYSIYSKRGLFENLSPARDNVFFYTLDKTTKGIQMETDYG